MSKKAARDIVITGAHEHNLRHVDVTIPRNSLTVITGLSGSGKSSLAFDTLYAEGQRRYVESLSAYARQFLDQMNKPKVENIEGLSPAISIEQKTVSKNPRSTVGTVTEIYDYLRVLYANIGLARCAHCGKELGKQSVQQIVDTIMSWPARTKVVVMAPVVRGRKGEYKQLFELAEREGFTRVKVDGEMLLLEDEIKLDKKLKHDISLVVARLIVADKIQARLTDSIETALNKADGLVTVERLASDGSSEEITFSQSMACPEHGPQLVELSPRMFSFNSPFGACQKCNGLGKLNEIDPGRVVADPEISIIDGALLPWAGFFKIQKANARKKKAGNWSAQWATAILKHFKVDPESPWNELTDKQQETLLYGSKGKKVKIKYAASTGSNFETNTPFEGVIPRLERKLRESDGAETDEILGKYFSEQPCPDCNGQRLKRESLGVTIKGLNVSEFCAQTSRQALDFIEQSHWAPRELQIGQQALKEIHDRLEFMNYVGLDYLTLDRAAATLAGGEAQRIRLATQLGSQLVGVLYVLDEPSIGLHPRDNDRLIAMLTKLRDIGNTVVVVEHDESMIRAADYVIDLGPGAGRLGGELVAQGPPETIVASAKSMTAQYLTGEREVPVPKSWRRVDTMRMLTIRGARHHNLNDIDVPIPLGRLVCVTGVSGSGKSTLVHDILYTKLANFFYRSNQIPGDHDKIEGVDHLDKIILVDQSPIGRTPRSNPATYTNIYSEVRNLFATLPESRMRGYKPGRFSFNVAGGRCENCKGDGLIKVEMHFLPDIFVECEACNGRRFNRETLEILYKDRNIADVLEMTVEEAMEFFDAIPNLKRRLKTLNDVGLGYIHLGQSATTLSGGEAQRVKLSRELGKRGTGKTLYILDEPTTGLHFEDVRKLIEVLERLVEEGNSVLVIEHNLDVMKCADWIIDLGPEGGTGGGNLVATGTPREIANNPDSITGRSLIDVLGEKKQPPKKKATKKKSPPKKKAAKKSKTKPAAKKVAKKKPAKKKTPAKKTGAKKKK